MLTDAILKSRLHITTYAGDAFCQRFRRDAVDGRHLLVAGSRHAGVKEMAVYLYRRTEYEIWKLKFYYSH
jgi:hypothetical protein